jgi:hypothetical protein
MMAPEVAADATSPARTPARIREEITREKKQCNQLHSRDFTGREEVAISGTCDNGQITKTVIVVVIRRLQFDNCDQ